MIPDIPTSIIYEFKQGKWAKPPHNANYFWQGKERLKFPSFQILSF